MPARAAMVVMGSRVWAWAISTSVGMGVFLLGVVVGLVVEVEGAAKHGVHEVFGGEHLVEGGFVHEAFF